MSAVHSSPGAPLLGCNLVRLIYLDESGTDRRAPHLAVAGVLIHGDRDWPEVERRMLALIEEHVPEPNRVGFIFHATDIFHGSGYFDRRKPEWNDENKRREVLDDLAGIIDDLHLPIVAGWKDRGRFGAGILPASAPFKGEIMHGGAVADSLLRADRWLAKFSPNELATVIHEDVTRTKRLVKGIVRTLRSEDEMRREGFSPEFRERFGLPLKRIIDTVHFAEKADARPLQLADLCAFVLARALKDAPVPTYAFDVIWRHMRWAHKDAASPTDAVPVPSSDKSPS